MNTVSDVRVDTVHASECHAFSKATQAAITLTVGHGVVGDAHAGATVQHRSRVARDPTQPNLRQVHLLPVELLEALATRGYPVAPGELGENVTTRGIDLLGLARGTRLRLGDAAVVEITGLRNPCAQIDRFRPGLLGEVLDRLPDGTLVRKAGVMAVVCERGVVSAGDRIDIVCVPDVIEPLLPV